MRCNIIYVYLKIYMYMGHYCKLFVKCANKTTKQIKIAFWAYADVAVFICAACADETQQFYGRARAPINAGLTFSRCVVPERTSSAHMNILIDIIALAPIIIFFYVLLFCIRVRVLRIISKNTRGVYKKNTQNTTNDQKHKDHTCLSVDPIPKCVRG